MIKLVEMPQAFVESSDYQDLDEGQRTSLVRRLDNARILGESLASGRRLSEALDIGDFFQNLELDVAILQELDSAPAGGLSRWLLHYSWTFETSPGELRESLPKGVVQLIDWPEPKASAPVDEFVSWFKDAGSQLVVMIDEFSAASTSTTALAIHALLDILLVRVLLTCYKLRLNRAVSR